MKVTLFTKDGCGLCREAERLLRSLQRKIRFELELVDIETDPAVFDRYWARVPVVVVDGKEVSAAPLDERRLRRVLAA